MTNTNIKTFATELAQILSDIEDKRVEAKWVAKIGCQRSGPAHIGYFPTFDEAKAAREAAERTLGYADNGRRSRL